MPELVGRREPKAEVDRGGSGEVATTWKTHNMLPNLRLSTRWPCAFVIVGITFLFYLHFVLTFGVNVPFWDDWQLLDKARQIYLGQMDWWKLIVSKHNEHLIGTAFLVEAWQLLATGFDYKLQLVTGVLIQSLTFGLLTATLWRSIPESRRTSWLVVSSFIFFSLAQHKDLLWAFQTAWFLISLFLAVSLICLRRAEQQEARKAGRSGVWLSVAVAAALLATFTSLHGILVWVAGVVYLGGCQSFHVRESLRAPLLRKWLVSAILAGLAAAYVWTKLGSGLAEGGGKFSWPTLLKIFVGIHGDFWGNLGFGGLIVLGIGMLGLVCFALAQVRLSEQKAVYALPVSLIAFGISFVLLVAVGRAKFGIGPVSDSHYTAYSVFTYFGVLSILMWRDDTKPRFFRSLWGPFVYSAVILLAAFTSYYDALLHGIAWRSEQGMHAALLLKYREEPDFVLAQTLFGDPALVRKNAEFLEANHLGAFADSRAVPEPVSNYTVMPRSLKDVIGRHPEQQEAIYRAWQVYQIGSDLRNAFNPVSPDFAQGLLDWCAASSQAGSDHYLSRYLMPFARDYSAIKKAESPSQDSPLNASPNGAKAKATS